MSSSEEHGPSAWLGSIAEVLDDLGIAWVLAGALAADRYRTGPRFTADLDLLIEWDDRLPAALDRLDHEVRSMADPGEHPHLIRLASATERIDLIIAVVAYQRHAIERGREDRVLTIEDVVVHKLIAWRLKDRDDISSILAGEPDLDAPYIEEWATAWEVMDRWDQAQAADPTG